MAKRKRLTLAVTTTTTKSICAVGVAAYNKDVGIARMAAARIYSVIDYESKIDGLSEEGIKSDRLNGSLAVSGINFAYPSAPEIQILHDLSFSVAKGKSVALVGHSGCGKSTIVNLLMRFYSPNSGSIKIDGTKIEKYNLPWLRGKIGLVAQQPPLLPGTIRDNVAIGKEHATQDEIEAACKAANAHDFIVGFPDGYNTNVGSLGNKLSGGQRQRVAIASVIIAQPEILILDEATSALDKISEAKFQKVMDETADGRATVVIAHRLSTIRDCDEILVFDHGHVVERGSHETLVELGGIYYGMLHKQGVEEESDKTTDDASLATLTDECGFGASQMQEKAAPSSDVQVALTGADVDAKAKADAQMSGKDEKEKEQKKKEKEQQKAAANWVWSMAKPDRGFFWLAVLASLICGFTVPLGNLVLAYILLVMLGSWDTEIYTCDMAASAFTFTSSYANPENPNYSAVQVCQYFCSTELERGCRLCMPYIDGNTTSAYSISYNDTCSQTTACGPAGCAASFTQPGDEDAINELLPYLVYCAVACSLFGFVNGYSQYIAGEGLTFRLRALFYDHFLKQSMGWHDAHATSELTESLAIDAAAARKLQLDQYPAVVGAMVGIFGSLFLGFFYCWQWSLVVMAVAPVIILFQSLEMALIMGKETNVSADQENASNAEKNHGVMMIQNQKMIAGVGRSKEFLGRYIDKVDASMGDLKAQLAKVAVLSFLSMFVTMGLFLSFSFWWAFELQIDGHCNNEEFMKSFIPFMFGIFMAPMMMMLVPDKTKAVPAITHSYLLLNEEDTTKVPSNDTSSGKSASKVDEAVIELKDVKFAYPTRLQAQVLNGASLSIKAGQTVAIVGGSGCGKSTVLHLLQKNYPIQGGEILIGGKNINDLDTEVYREQIATVEQEPKLFNRKIRDNIAYRPQEAPVTIEAIQAAAKSAFAHTFIEGIQDTYDFVVGKFGSRVSGESRFHLACFLRFRSLLVSFA